MCKLPEGIQPLRLVWDCTTVLPESAWQYFQTLATPETVMLLEPSTLERYRQVSLLPMSLLENEQAEQRVTNQAGTVHTDTNALRSSAQNARDIRGASPYVTINSESAIAV